MKQVKRFSFKLQQHVFALCIACFAIIFCNMQALHAQTTNASPAKSLKAFDGVYKFQGDQDAYLQITAKADKLTLKQLWDGKEFIFDQTASLEFYCSAQSFPLKFKDSASNIVQVLAFDKDIWNKVKDYKPVVKKEIKLTPAELSVFEGKYKMKGGDADDILQITTQSNNLILKQLWDGQVITFIPLSLLDFYCAERMFPLQFTKDKDGNVLQALAFNKDVWMKVH